MRLTKSERWLWLRLVQGLEDVYTGGRSEDRIASSVERALTQVRRLSGAGSRHSQPAMHSCMHAHIHALGAIWAAISRLAWPEILPF